MHNLRKVSMVIMAGFLGFTGSLIGSSIVYGEDSSIVVTESPNVTAGVSEELGNMIVSANYEPNVTAGVSKVLENHIKGSVMKETTVTDEVEEQGPELVPFDSVRSYYVKAKNGINVRSVPSADSDDTIIDTLGYNTKIKITGKVKDSNFYYIESKDNIKYVSSKFLSSKKLPELKKKQTSASYTWNGQKLNRRNGTVDGPSGKETYYNMNMHGVIEIMRRMGNTDAYWIREDGCKMLGQYIMVAANLNVRPRGSLVPTSLGMGIVCDTGTFVYTTNVALDIAVNW